MATLHRHKRLTLQLLFGTVFLAILINGWSVANAPVDIRILWTNDTHGYLSPLYHREEGDDLFIERANREGRVGGFAYIATIINRQRSELPESTLLLDAGDTWHGTVVPVRMAGSPVVELMNKMGYQAMVPGNVDFFYDRETLESLFSSAEFPILMANIYDAEWDERVELSNVKPYIVKQYDGLKVGIVGMTYHWMSKVTEHKQWSFGLRVQEVQADIDHLREQEDVDLVVLLSHMGWRADTQYAELVNGIDVIVGAHTHDILYRPTIINNEKSNRDVLVVQAGSHGKMVGQLDLHVDKGRVIAFEQILFPISTKDVTPDPEIARYIEELRAPYKAELERVIGETTALLYRQGTWQSTADNLVTDALRARTNRDIVVKQPGRFGATILPGPITVEDVYNIIPAESTIYQMKFSGQQLRAMFEDAVDNVITEDVMQQIGGYMWRFSGLELTVDLSKPYPNRIQKITVDSKPIISDAVYSLAEFDMFFRNSPQALDVQETDKIGPREVIAYIEKQGKVTGGLDRRITDTQGQIMSDHPHLDETWSATGRDAFDLDGSKVFKYKGRRDKSGRLIGSK
ncbi:MAG: bifunctional metallophosphatase/5'-nucleotidase [bacterium]